MKKVATEREIGWAYRDLRIGLGKMAAGDRELQKVVLGLLMVAEDAHLELKRIADAVDRPVPAGVEPDLGSTPDPRAVAILARLADIRGQMGLGGSDGGRAGRTRVDDQ